MRPFRFGLGKTLASSAAEYREAAHRAEGSGYDVMLCADHLGALSPTVALATVAGATSRLRVSPFVLNNDFRNPLLMAQEAATLDLLSDGRFEMALGAGWNKPEYDQAGIGFDRAGLRIQRLEESVTILKRLLAGETVSFESDNYTISEHTLNPQPPQGADLPLMIGGDGDRVLAVGARHASIVGMTGIRVSVDGVDFTNFTTAGAANRIDHIRREAGERADRIELNSLVQRVEITNDRRGAAQTIVDRWQETSAVAGPGVDDVLESPFMLLGTVSQVTDQLRTIRSQLGLSYFVVRADGSEEFDAVVEELTGT